MSYPKRSIWSTSPAYDMPDNQLHGVSDPMWELPTVPLHHVHVYRLRIGDASETRKFRLRFSKSLCSWIILWGWARVVVYGTWFAFDRWRTRKAFGATFQIAAPAIVVPVCQLNFRLDFNDVAPPQLYAFVWVWRAIWIIEYALQKHRTSRVYWSCHHTL